MPNLFNSYLRYARGEGGRYSPWALLNALGAVVHPFVRLRNAFYDRGIYCSADPPIPVISVGNLCHGGTNKTPMVEMIARKLAEFGLEVGIVSRGYGGETKVPLLVGRGGKSSDRSVTGDEALMLASRLPNINIAVSKDRYEGVRLLAEEGAEVAVADDAFQHRRMGRDLDIVLIDATCPFGNGRLFPAGILREHREALKRADIVILTKTEQASPESIIKIRTILSKFLPYDRIFSSRVALDSWLEISRGEITSFEPEWGQSVPEGKFMSFSAIGNPESFYRSLVSSGVTVLENVAYRDHHRFSWKDIDELERRAAALGATGLMCTEKDLQNMPGDYGFSGHEQLFVLPLYVPRITVSVDREESFWRVVTKKLRPRFVVASNGYGEDAMGALLASRLKERFPMACVSAFTLVGKGKEYEDRGIDVFSPPSDMPSGGIIKYSLSALFKDLRHGLRHEIRKQIDVWRANQGRYRTPICVGDVYLFAHTLFGQGLSPLLLATAKTVKLSGHRRLERVLLRKRARIVWTRDAETAAALKRSGVEAVFCGNPVMDLALGRMEMEYYGNGGAAPWDELPKPRIMLLPGSRPRAYEDMNLLIKTVELIAAKRVCSFVMVLAPTIERAKILEGVSYECDEGGDMHVAGSVLRVWTGPIAPVAIGADILIGLGGTANQVSAGLGVPVISIIERGKHVQKKLLRDAELLVPAAPEALCEAALELLEDHLRRNVMARAGISEMGGSGAIDAVLDYVSGELGWRERCKLYMALFDTWTPDDKTVINEMRSAYELCEGNMRTEGVYGKWRKRMDLTEKTGVSETLRLQAARLVKLARDTKHTENLKDFQN